MGTSEAGAKQYTIDWSKIENYIKHSLQGVPQNEEMHVKKFTEGYSNLTYFIRIGDWQAVLRRPPFGKTPPKAHDMEREYRILEKVHPIYPLAPKPLLYCEDPEIMEKHFYIMEKKNGVVIDAEIPVQFENNEKTRKQISKAFIQAFVQLHSIDIEKNDLMELGKPKGYMTRQVQGWITRYNRAKTDEIAGIEEVENWLLKHTPNNPEATIIHNDFKLNNMMFQANDPSRVIGVFDWELATIGDPLADVGSTLVYWSDGQDPDMGITVVTDQKGFYSRREFLEQYAKLSGRDVANITYYLTFGFYKLAGILQQIYYRWKIGEAKDERFSTLNQSIANLIELANDSKENRIL